MALLWCDGFDHYGITNNLTEGVYAEISGASINTTNPRTGANCITVNNIATFRRVLGGAKTTVGLGGAFYLPSLPTSNTLQRVFEFRDAANVANLSIGIESTGVITAYRGPLSGTAIGVTAAPVVFAETYQHIEALVFFSQTVGTVEVRVNGVTVLSLSGVDTVNTALVECSQVVLGGGRGAGAVSHQLDDVFAYDETGSYNNSFIGDRRVITLFPNANTATADWTAVGAASGYECIDEANPDGDTSYISATAPGTPGPISEFGFDNLPAGISAINGVVLVEFARKTEAGVANTQWSIKSGASETAGADKPMTEIYTYRQDVFETDPASAAPFTPAAVDAVLAKVERTA